MIRTGYGIPVRDGAGAGAAGNSSVVAAAVAAVVAVTAAAVAAGVDPQKVGLYINI